jgi:hypothetical protein
MQFIPTQKETEQMKKNIGSVDRIIRIVAGLGILSLVFIGPETKWGYLGLIPLATGLIGWCPPYHLLGISTCKSCK